jgi:hypothetical protein
MITTNNKIKIIKHPKNLGKGAAIKQEQNMQQESTQ